MVQGGVATSDDIRVLTTGFLILVLTIAVFWQIVDQSE